MYTVIGRRGCGCDCQFPKPDSALLVSEVGSQVPSAKKKPGAPPPFTAPAGSGAGASQVPFPPKGQPGVPPPFTAPAGFGPAESQRPFLDPQRRPPAPPPVPSGDVIPILVDERDGPHPDGSYSFNFETGNGISHTSRAPQGRLAPWPPRKDGLFTSLSSNHVIFQQSRHLPAITSSSSNHVIFQQSRHLSVITSSSSNNAIFQQSRHFPVIMSSSSITSSSSNHVIFQQSRHLPTTSSSSNNAIFQQSRHLPAITSSSSNHVIFQQSRHLPAMPSSSNHVIFQQSCHLPAIMSSSSNHVIFQQLCHLPAIASSSSNHHLHYPNRFTLPDGTPAVFTFVADEFGYRVESDLLPTPHPLPAHAIAQIEFARQQKASVALSIDLNFV
ncbi:Cuticle protein [Homarus americanus]|uniref:Cuticle protein n=1 Tax=Homarus americanus TaxID=6706 RepID=A0A8J5N508_HOMAM|nr:Cuticle protein [Homarus americanus]